MFLVALVLVVSALYCVLAWTVALHDEERPAALEDIIENIDLDKLKKDYDMVAAMEEISLPSAAPSIVVAAERVPAEEPVAADNEDATEEDETEAIETATALDDVPPRLITPINDRESLMVMESMPEFPGGAAAFMQWLTANIHYPATARDKKIEGRVVVSFIIDSEGKVKKLRIEESNNHLLSTLVINVLGTMPPWTPGVQHGERCATMIRVPINFEL